MENIPLKTRGVVETILYTDDLERSAAFYRDTFGFPAMGGDRKRFVVFDIGEGRALLLFRRGGTLEPAVVPGGVIPPHDGRGPHHIGFGISPADYEHWKNRLLSAGIPIESECRWARGGRSLYFRDPDQHLLELVTPGIWPNY